MRDTEEKRSQGLQGIAGHAKHICIYLRHKKPLEEQRGDLKRYASRNDHCAALWRAARWRGGDPVKAAQDCSTSKDGGLN